VKRGFDDVQWHVNNGVMVDDEANSDSDSVAQLSCYDTHLDFKTLP
jgi:hypothetical protein